jgi:hypothetical protein
VDWAEFWAIFSQTHQVALVLASFSWWYKFDSNIIWVSFYFMPQAFCLLLGICIFCFKGGKLC